MNNKWCIDTSELKEVEAVLKLAVRLGFIEEEGLDAVEKRRIRKNEETEKKLAAGERVYGLTHYSAPAYLQYELTRFRLDFVSGKAQKYGYHSITEAKKEHYYKENSDLFTRYFGEAIPYESVGTVIEKRLREEEYYELIKNILCQFQKRE